MCDWDRALWLAQGIRASKTVRQRPKLTQTLVNFALRYVPNFKFTSIRARRQCTCSVRLAAALATVAQEHDATLDPSILRRPAAVLPHVALTVASSCRARFACWSQR
jgi:hypothetical protein